MTTYNQYGTLQIEKQVQVVQGIGQSKHGLGDARTSDLIAELTRRTTD